MTIIILAAGLSKRMGENKLLLPFNNKTILESVINTSLMCDCPVVVVTGHNREKIAPIIHSYNGITEIYNENYIKGQKSSALKAIEEIADDFLILPGDLPLISSKTIEEVIESPSSISRPFFNNIPGHPVGFKKENREGLLGFPGSFKDYLDCHNYAHLIGDIGCIFDTDTPERYKALVNANGNLSILEGYLNV